MTARPMKDVSPSFRMSTSFRSSLPQDARTPRPRPMGMCAALRHARHPSTVPHAPVSVGPGVGAGAMLLVVVPCALVPGTPCNQHHSPRNGARRTPLTTSVLARRTPPRSPPLPPAAASRVQAASVLSLPHTCPRAARTCCCWCRPLCFARTVCRRTTRPCRSHRQTCACPCPAEASTSLATVQTSSRGDEHKARRRKRAALWQRWWRWHDACVDTAGVAVAHGPLCARAEARVGRCAAAAGDR
jgi:hypothetical protein